MYFQVAFLIAIIAYVESSSNCPYPDVVLCGSDGNTYRNMCKWKVATFSDPELKLRDLGPCENNPLQELFWAIFDKDEKKDVLRRRKRRRKRTRNKSKMSNSIDYLQRLASLPFNFLRERDEEHDD